MPLPQAVRVRELEQPIEEQAVRRSIIRGYGAMPMEFSQSKIVKTTGATLTTLHTIPLNDNSAYLIVAHVTGRRTGGAAGTAGDAAAYIRTGAFRRNAAGNTVQIGTTTSEATFEDQAAWDCQLNVSTTNVVVQVAGAASNNISWISRVQFQEINQ